MKNETKNEKQKMQFEKNWNLKSQNGSLNSKIKRPDLKEKSNLPLISNFGHICDIEDKLCKGPPGNKRSQHASRGHPPEILEQIPD